MSRKTPRWTGIAVTLTLVAIAFAVGYGLGREQPAHFRAYRVTIVVSRRIPGVPNAVVDTSISIVRSAFFKRRGHFEVAKGSQACFAVLRHADMTVTGSNEGFFYCGEQVFSFF